MIIHIFVHFYEALNNSRTNNYGLPIVGESRKRGGEDSCSKDNEGNGMYGFLGAMR